MINNLLPEVLSTVAEQEKINIRTRQSDGIAVARTQGRRLGRAKADIQRSVKRYIQNGNRRNNGSKCNGTIRTKEEYILQISEAV